MRRRELIINVALLCGTVVAFFVVLELGVRLSGLVSLTPRPPQIYEDPGNPELSYALRPNIREKAFRATVTTNSLGLRGPEPDMTKPVMAVLGDSITFGYGLEDGETLPARLQERFPDWSLVNGGVPGYTIGQEAALYEERIARLQPKALIVVFYFNDLNDQRPPVLDATGNLRQPGWDPSMEPDCMPITEGVLRWVPGQCWMNRNSALFVGIRKFLSARQEHRNLEAQRQEYAENAEADRVPREQVDAYVAAFERFARDLPDMPRLFVIWPDKRMLVHERPALKAMAEARGFTVLDLYDAFGNEAETLAWDTVHPSAKTVEEAAALVGDALRRVIPARP